MFPIAPGAQGLARWDSAERRKKGVSGKFAVSGASSGALRDSAGSVIPRRGAIEVTCLSLQVGFEL
jgi:hypothetical protein